MIKKLIEAASGRQKSDLVLKNAKIVNVFSNEIIEGNLAVTEGHFVGIGNYEGEKEIDLQGLYVAPGLIDAHVHIESSSSSPLEFARAVLPRGTTTVVADPHEIANVLGLDGIRYMLDASEQLPLTCYFMLPSCVPATSFETAGASLKAKDLEKLAKHERILGLGELMNYPGVVSGDQFIIDKIEMINKYDKFIDGHGPVIRNEELNAYAVVGIRSDHECTKASEMINQIRVGMYIAIREGSACKDLLSLIPGVTKENERRMLFCTDDRHPGDIMSKGHIDNNIRLAISAGVDPITAIRMATLNTAECYHLKKVGAIAPGYKADFVIVDNLDDFNVLKTYVSGKRVEEDWYKDYSNPLPMKVTTSIKIKSFTESDFDIHLKSDLVNVIEVIPDSIVTRKVVEKVNLKDGKFVSGADVLPFYVVERHFATGNIGKGFIKGFGLKGGAIASSISHDSHNISCISDSAKDAFIAVKEIETMGGGVVIVKDGSVIGKLPLPIAGLMSDGKMEDVSSEFRRLYHLTYDELGVSSNLKSLMTLSFMALPVIPEIKLTDKGLFDVLEFKHIDIEAT